MSTAAAEPQRVPMTWEMFLDINEDVRRDLEIIDGYVIPREQRSPDHQKVGFRLAAALEEAAVSQMRKAGPAECYRTNTEVDVLLWEVPPTARKADALLHRCLEPGQLITVEDVLIVCEVLSTWSVHRDRLHKMAEYADAGIPNYWLVEFDKIGAVSIERYALAGPVKAYTHIGTTHRDMGPVAISVTSPFPMEILWDQLEIEPRV